MFDVGQKVICVRKEPWKSDLTGASYGPAFGEECTVLEVAPKGTLFRVPGSPVVGRSLVDALLLVEWDAGYDARYFRPKEPNIEALRSLLVSNKQMEKV
jgi:hypothetical protein